METSDINTNSTTSEQKLYAGKFKTVEDLENGYKNSAVIYDENEKLKKSVAELSTVPTEYLNPSDVTLEDARVADIRERAKAAGMTQQQYEKFLRDDAARLAKIKSSYEENLKSLGEEKLNLLKDYVSKHYPPELADNMLKTFIQNQAAREAAFKHREAILNNQVPGMNKVTAGGYAVTAEDVKKAYAAKEANKHDLKARQHYINILEAYGNQN